MIRSRSSISFGFIVAPIKPPVANMANNKTLRNLSFQHTPSSGGTKPLSGTSAPNSRTLLGRRETADLRTYAVWAKKWVEGAERTLEWRGVVGQCHTVP